jgi:hypothetical protein
MRRFLLLTVLLGLPLVTLGQTQMDRLSVTTVSNRALPVLTGSTPSVAFGNVFTTSSNGTISNFTNGVLTQQIWIICADTNTAIASSGNIVTSGGTLNCQPDTVYSFILYLGNVWVQSGTTGSGGGGGGGSATTPGLPTDSVQVGVGGVFTGDSHFLWTPSTGLGITGGSGYTHSLATGPSNLNLISLAPSSVTLSAGDTASSLSFLSTAATSFTVGTAHPFSLPTASGSAGTVLMSNGANPQVTSWSNSFTSGLSAPLGTLTTDINPFSLSFTLNNASQTFNGVKWTASNTAYGAGSFDYQFCAGVTGTACLTVDPLGRVQSANQVGSGDGSAAGNLEMAPGPLPSVLTNNVGIYAPASATGFLLQLPGNPCSGPLSVVATGAYGVISCVVKGAFSTLPTCSSSVEGSTVPVTDSTTNTWGATITGGSTNHVLAYCDGTNWTVAAK